MSTQSVVANTTMRCGTCPRTSEILDVGSQPEASKYACLTRSTCPVSYPAFGSYKIHASLRPDKCAIKRAGGEPNRGGRPRKILSNINFTVLRTALNPGGERRVLSFIRNMASFTLRRCPDNYLSRDRKQLLRNRAP